LGETKESLNTVYDQKLKVEEVIDEKNDKILQLEKEVVRKNDEVNCRKEIIDAMTASLMKHEKESATMS
jgi:hypothetical protein